MLYPLLQAIATQLASELGGVFSEPDRPASSAGDGVPIITLGQASDSSRPHILLRPGALMLKAIGQAENPPLRQTIAINPNQPLGPYPLSQPATSEAFTVRPLNPDEHSEFSQVEPLVLDQDFTLDETKTRLTLIQPLFYPRLLVQYTADATTSLQEFQQDFWLTITARDAATVDRLTTLTLGSLLTSQDRLLASYQSGLENSQYRTEEFGARPSLRQLQLIKGEAAHPDSGVGFQLQWQVSGQITLTRYLEASPAPIRQVDLKTTTAQQG